jgi:hypothetical protein
VIDRLATGGWFPHDGQLHPTEDAIYVLNQYHLREAGATSERPGGSLVLVSLGDGKIRREIDLRPEYRDFGRAGRRRSDFPVR